MSDKEYDTKLLRYGELASLKAREEAKPEQLHEMNEIREKLGLSDLEVIDLVEKLVHQKY